MDKPQQERLNGQDSSLMRPQRSTNVRSKQVVRARQGTRQGLDHGAHDRTTELGWLPHSGCVCRRILVSEEAGTFGGYAIPNDMLLLAFWHRAFAVAGEFFPGS